MKLIEQQLCEMGFRKPNISKLEVYYKYPLGRVDSFQLCV